MVKAPLVVPDLEFGKSVLRQLDAASFPISVAIWIFNREDDEWRLVIGSPLYEKLGAQKAYQALIDALSADEPIMLMDLPIHLMGNRKPLIRELRQRYGKSTVTEGMRIGLQSIGDRWIDDAYVYRIKK